MFRQSGRCPPDRSGTHRALFNGISMAKTPNRECTIQAVCGNDGHYDLDHCHTTCEQPDGDTDGTGVRNAPERPLIIVVRSRPHGVSARMARVESRPLSEIDGLRSGFPSRSLPRQSNAMVPTFNEFRDVLPDERHALAVRIRANRSDIFLELFRAVEDVLWPLVLHDLRERGVFHERRNLREV